MYPKKALTSPITTDIDLKSIKTTINPAFFDGVFSFGISSLKTTNSSAEVQLTRHNFEGKSEQFHTSLEIGVITFTGSYFSPDSAGVRLRYS